VALKAPGPQHRLNQRFIHNNRLLLLLLPARQRPALLARASCLGQTIQRQG
jgi:hypothetical protein